MKNILILAFILAAQIAFGQPVRYNSLTTNQEPVALGVVTNIANTYATNGTNFALSIGANGTNYTLLTGANGTNLTVATSNGLYALITSSGPTNGVNATTSTNIAAYQALIATNALAVALGNIQNLNYLSQASTNGLATTNQIFSLRRGIVFTRASHGGYFQSNETGSQISDATSSNTTYIVRIQATTASRNLQFLFGNSEQDTPATNAITIKASIQDDAGYCYPVTFQGQRTTTIQPGQFVLSDLMTGVIPTNQQVFHMRTMVSVPLGVTYWLGQVHQLSDEGVALNSDVVDGGSFSSVIGYSYMPMAIYGDVPVGTVTIAGIGDSIMSDYSAQLSGGTNNLYNQAYWQIAISPPQTNLLNNCTNFGSGWSHIDLSMQGDRALSFSYWTNHPYKNLLLQGVNYVIDDFGINDISVYTLAQMENAASNVWNNLAGLGIKVYQTTLTPYTTSTDSWSTTNNQTPVAGNSVRTNFNAWLRQTATNGTVPSLSGLIDLASAAGIGDNYSFWKTNYTIDGLHPYGPTAALAMAAYTANVVTNQFKFPNAIQNEVQFGLSQGSNFVGSFQGTVIYPTNSQSTVVNLGQRYSDVSTNANFAWVGYAGLLPNVYQFTTVFLTNTSGSVINFTAPANTHTNGTFNCTNSGVTRVEFVVSGSRWTNAIATPLF